MNQTCTIELSKKYLDLKQYFKNYHKKGICIAYSGGVDSTLLLRAAVESFSADYAKDSSSDADSALFSKDDSSDADSALFSKDSSSDTGSAQNIPVLAVILETQLHPHSDTELAYTRAEALGAQPVVITVDEFQNPDILQNPVNRCYLCKKMLFSSLKELAKAKGYHAVFDGTNKDDESEYRPGMKVLKELDVKSPLLELGITKAAVRSISAMLGLPTAAVPSTPCLATRLPYGAFLDQNLLKRIHQGEILLRQKGFYNVRLRYHEPILRLEIDCSEFETLLSMREEILCELKKLEFLYVTLDLEGFRSGSMDIGILSR